MFLWVLENISYSVCISLWKINKRPIQRSLGFQVKMYINWQIAGEGFILMIFVAWWVNTANLSFQRYLLSQAQMLLFSFVILMSTGLMWVLFEVTQDFSILCFYCYFCCTYRMYPKLWHWTIIIPRKYFKTRRVSINNDLKQILC